MFGTSVNPPVVAVPVEVDPAQEAPAVAEAPVVVEVGAAAVPVEGVAVDRPHRRQEHPRCRCPSAVGPMMSPCDF